MTGQTKPATKRPRKMTRELQSEPASTPTIAPPRRRVSNERQDALLTCLLSDPEGRPMVSTYGAKGTRRYAYYETRKDLARPGDPAATRIQRGLLDRYITDYLHELLADDHRMRRLSGFEDAERLRALFEQAHRLSQQLRDAEMMASTIRSVVRSICFHKDDLELRINPNVMGIDRIDWTVRMPRPTRKPFREAKLRIDAGRTGADPDPQLLGLLAEARAAQSLILASPELSLNQLGKREGRCRTQLARLLRISWLSPKIVEAIAAGTQPKSMTRKLLIASDFPIEWEHQEALFGIAT